MTTKTVRHEHWSSRLGFLMAAVGSAVGLGNFWKFPYEAGENGGGAFVFVYLCCIVFVGMPIMWSEFIIGRRGKMSGPASYRVLAEAGGHSSIWAGLGWLAVIAAFLVVSFYSVIAGWVLYYIFEAVTGNIAGKSPDEIAGIFNGLLASPGLMLGCHAVFMGLTTFIITRGVRGGIERASMILMPLFVLLMATMVIYALTTGASGEAVTFLFSVDFSKITFEVAIEAIGHAFFSLGVGAAIMITYGAYLDDDVNIPQNAVTISIADTGVAILAGLAIFPVVFAFGLAANEGPGLLFVTLPTAFAEMSFGVPVAILFFVLAFVAALTSALSLLEVVVSRLEEIPGFSRVGASITAGGAAFSFGLLTVFSFNELADFHPLDFIPMFEGKTPFDLIDFLASNLFLPLSGIAAAVFAGWVITRDAAAAELGMSTNGIFFRTWRFLVRWFAPIAVGLVLLGLFGVFDLLFGNGG